jgi:amino acid adenylation domain-containing protein
MGAAEFLPPTSRAVVHLTPAALTASTESFLLTEPQQEIWLAAQMGEDGAIAYNESLRFDFRGAFDADLFRTAARRVIERHPILLARLGADGQSQQVPVGATLDIPLVDLTGESDGERERALAATIDRHISDPFELTSGPLLRVSMLRLTRHHHVVVWTAHHIVCDGWSHGVVVDELATIYAALAQGAPVTLAAPASFREYALQSLADTPHTRAALAYWQRQFAVLPEPLDLPADRPRPPVRSTRAGTVSKALGTSLHQALKRAAGRERATMVVLMAAALQTLLARLSGQTDLVIGMPVAGQAVSGHTCLVGHCVNLLPVRTNLDPDASFHDTIKAVKKSVLDAFDHHQCTLGRILQTVKVPRDASRPPLVDVIFNIDKDAGPSAFPGLEFSLERNPKRASHFDLFFNVVEGADSFAVECDYNTDLFDRATIERWLGHYQTLLEAVANDASVTMARLPVLTAAERVVLITGRNTPHVEFPREQTLHGWFERQAARQPHATAVTFAGTHVTYGELNRRANQIAHRLKRLGVGPDVLVGLFVERSHELIVGILAILKAGGAYLPIDPIYPKDRVTFMLEDAGVSVVLTHSALTGRVGARAATILCFDTDLAALDGEADADPPHASSPDHLAYVIYTSGSTGQPKGSLITHHNVVRLMRATEGWYGFNEQDVWTLFHSHAFDFSVWELWGALLYGGRVVVIPHLTSRSPEEFYRLLQDEHVTVLNQTPSAFKQLIDADARLGPSPELALRYVIFGGEALEMRDLTPWFARHGDERPRLVNMYGITETTVHVTYRPLSVADLDCRSVIGVPIPDLQVYVLDRHQQPVPIGVTGEIYVGGAGVARGYLRREELTGQRFLPDPFSGKPGGLLYRSGDLARYASGGDLEYVGRADDQVKIRGFRVELGEIEALLCAHDSVEQCAVIAREDSSGQKELVAYLRLGGGHEPAERTGLATSGHSPDDLRTYLRERLPDHMVPSAFVVLDRFPLTPNGKLDRRALPAPLSEHRLGARDFVAPRTEIEQAVARIWADVLSIDTISADDDFFALGGHSLLAIRAVARLRDAFDLDLTPRTFFASPTVAGLARAIADARSAGSTADRITRRRVTGPRALSFAQEGLWFLDQLAPGSAVYNIVDVVRFHGTCDPEVIKRALREVVRRHDALRTIVANVEGQPVQVVLPTIDLDVPELDLSALADQQREREWARIAHEAGRRPFSLSEPPLLRAVLVRLTSQQSALLLTLHHIVADEWSMEVLGAELREIYQAFSIGGPSPMAELPIQYADFAEWQREWLKGDVLQTQLAYWKGELAGAPTVLRLPTDRPRPPAQSFRGATEGFALPKALLESLTSLSRQEHATLFMTLMAGFMALLQRCTGQDDVLVGTPISGRTRSETEKLIGLFLNTLVLRATFTADVTFRSLLGQIRDRALRAYGHQDLPLEQLVAALAPARDLSRAPLFQVMFVRHNAAATSQAATLSGLQQLETGTSKFDLTLFVSETEQGIEGLIEYSTDLFDAATMRRLSEQYGALLQAISVNPDQRVATLPLLPEADRQQMLVDWNRTGRSYPEDRSVHQLIEEQARRRPHHVAVSFGEERLTYTELNGRANQLAHYLARLGVARDVLVGVCVDRSTEMLVALLGILKAGGAYVPLDPAYPRERLAHMVEDSGMRVLVTHRGLEENLSVRPARVVRLDRESADIGKESPHDLVTGEARSDALAYVIYTSGSTGRPKGVQIAHRSLVNLLSSMRREPGLSSDDVLLAVTTLSFDIAGLELFLPLTTGATVAIAPRDAAGDAALLRSEMERSNATVVQATPVTWRLLLQAGWPGDPRLRILCGGEAMSPDLAEDLAPRCAELWNMYGPTETTIWSTCRRITRGNDLDIGRPIDNTEVFILDEARQPVPVGVVGELFIGGAGLARGYLGRAELTAERFTAHPFKPEERLYRSGDRARWRPGGTVAFLGRVDHQVKLRGLRVELGEIEATLQSHPAVREAVVLLREDRPGDQRLVAYVSGSELSATELRAHTRRSLPEALVPTAFVTMETWPLTPNGKLNRQALPAPPDDLQVAESAPRVPLTLAELRLAAIWSELLGRANIAATDDFFLLGGHSLLAIRLVHRVHQEFGVALPPGALFEHSMLRDLALRIDPAPPPTTARPATLQKVLVQMKAGGSGAPFFWVHGIGGEVYTYMQVSQHLAPTRSVYGFTADWTRTSGGEAPTLEAMAAHYVREMRMVCPSGPYHLGGYCGAALLAFEMARQLEAAGQRVGVLAALDCELSAARGDSSSLDAARALLKNLPRWVREDAMLSGFADVFGRFRSGIRRIGTRFRADAASRALDLRDQLGMWRFPDYQLAMLDAHHKAINAYRPKPFNGRVTLFLPRTAPLFGPWPSGHDPEWDRLALGGVDAYRVAGSHSTMLAKALAEPLAARLDECIVKAEREAPAPTEPEPAHDDITRSKEPVSASR